MIAVSVLTRTPKLARAIRPEETQRTRLLSVTISAPGGRL